MQRIATVFQTVNLKIKSVDESWGYAPQAVGEAEIFALNNPRHPLQLRQYRNCAVFSFLYKSVGALIVSSATW